MRRDPGFPAFICSRARPESAKRNAAQTQSQGESLERRGVWPESRLILALEGQEGRIGREAR